MHMSMEMYMDKDMDMYALCVTELRGMCGCVPYRSIASRNC